MSEQNTAVVDLPETFEEGVAQVEAAANDAVPAAAPQLPSPKVMVIYNFVRRDGTNGVSRVFLTGLYNIRSQGEIENIERLVIEQSKGDFAGVMVTNWKSLEG